MKKQATLTACAAFSRPRRSCSSDDLYIVPDAGSPVGDAIEVAEKGQLWLRVRTTGAQCHASAPQQGRNAFLAGADMVLAAHNGLRAAFADANPLFYTAFFHLPCPASTSPMLIISILCRAATSFIWTAACCPR